MKVALKVLVTSGPVNIALPLNDTDTAKAINDFLAKRKNCGFIDNLVAKYMVPHKRTSTKNVVGDAHPQPLFLMIGANCFLLDQG